MATVPERSLEQRKAALESAWTVREHNMQQVQAVRALGTVDASDRVAGILDFEPELVARIRVGRLLVAIRRVGRIQAAKWLTACDIRGLDRRVDQLSERQRVRLALLVREFGRRKAAGK